MDNCIVKGFKNIGEDICHLNSERPNRVRGLLWLTASVVAVAAGAALSALGVALCYGACFAKATIAGIPLGYFMVGVGIPLILSGVPAGLWVASKFVSRGWTDLTAKRIDIKA